ncbi:MAG: L,D-transpeptidase family protein [Chloroflexi bacterium]|nr:L,D-transpeptidase family protein [Chloroflexota bacterium]
MHRRELLKGGIGLGAALALGPLGAHVARAEERWVQTFKPADLWSNTGPTAISFGKVRPFTYLRVEGEDENGRLYVFNPKTQGYAYVDARNVGPAGPPSLAYLAGPAVLDTFNMPARIVGTASIYREPLVEETAWVNDLTHNDAVMVKDLVEADDGSKWYRLDDGTFVAEDGVRMPAHITPPAGRWIDVSLSAPTIVAAYENGKPLFSAMAIHGVGGWETPIGTYVLERRVANEVMTGPGYYVTGVLYTQYFTSAGHSIHYNYWSSNWGYAGSHGCLGMNYDDSFWFWNWATLGTPIDIHW